MKLFPFISRYSLEIGIFPYYIICHLNILYLIVEVKAKYKVFVKQKRGSGEG